MANNKVQVEIGAVFSKNFKQVFKDAKTSMKQLNDSIKNTREATVATNELKKLTDQTRKVAQQTKIAKQRLENLKRTETSTEGATRRLNTQIQAASFRYKENSRKLKELRDKLGQAGRTAKAYGINTKNLTNEQKRLSRTMDRLISRQRRLNNLQAAGSRIRGAVAGIGRAAVGVGIAAGIGGAVLGGITSPVNNLQESLAEIGARNNLNAQEAKKVEKLIRQTAAVSIFTGQQVGEAAVNLAKSGFTPKDLNDALQPLVNFASGERISSESAAGILSSTLQQFNLAADESSRVLNVISKTVNSAKLDVFDFSESMKFLGATASALNIPLEQASALILTLAKGGLRGGIATRAFRTSLLRLTDPTKEMSDLMAELEDEGFDVQFFDDSGNFIGLQRLLEKLEVVINSVDQKRGLNIVSNLFGSESATQILTVLSKGTSAFRQSVADLRQATKEDIVKRLADAQIGTVKGQGKILKSVFDELVTVLFRDSGLQQGFADTINNISTALFEFSQALSQDKETLTAIVDIVKGLGTAFTAVANVVKLVAGIILVALKPVLWIVEGILRALDLIASLFGDNRFKDMIKGVQGGQLLINNAIGLRDVKKEAAIQDARERIDNRINNIDQSTIKNATSFSSAPQNITVSQSINVDGSQDPEVVAKAIAKITKQEIESATFSSTPVDENFSYFQ